MAMKKPTIKKPHIKGQPKAAAHKTPHKPTPSHNPMAAIGQEQDRKYAAQSAFETLKRAEEIKADPALMRDVKAHAKEQIAHAQKIAGGKAGGTPA